MKHIFSKTNEDNLNGMYGDVMHGLQETIKVDDDPETLILLMNELAEFQIVVFERLKMWTDHFQLDTHLDDILKWINTTKLLLPYNSTTRRTHAQH